MNMDEKLNLTIKLKDITKAQAITFVNFMKEMEHCGVMGRSRNIAFYADGDGNFKPKIEHDLDVSDEEIKSYKECCERTMTTKYGTKITAFDFDGVYCDLYTDKMKTNDK
jgi:hypothetical protein